MRLAERKDKTSTPHDQSKGSCKIIPNGEVECVWANAGVVPYKLCNYNFECSDCAFDLVMRGGYELVPNRMIIRGYKFCPSYFYHPGHAWAKVEANAHVRIGIDDFGQNLLGKIDKISLPKKGEKLSAKSIKIGGRGSGISLTTPVEGYVIQTNQDLLTQPSLMNQSPYGRGWAVLLRPTRLSKNLRRLLYGSAAQRWFEAETIRLYCMIVDEIGMPQSEVGVTFQDGGMLKIDLLDRMKPKKIKEIVELFLSSHRSLNRF